VPDQVDGPADRSQLVGRPGRVVVLVAQVRGDLALSRQVDDILVAGGRPRDRLRYEEAPRFWMLDA
jgi:hypothetical protein